MKRNGVENFTGDTDGYLQISNRYFYDEEALKALITSKELKDVSLPVFIE